MADTDTDIETLIQDLRQQFEHLDRIKGQDTEGGGGELSDAQIAAELYQQELATQEQFLSDLALSRSIARAVESDAEIIQQTYENDNAEGAVPAAQGGAAAAPAIDHEALERLSELNNFTAVSLETLIAERDPNTLLGATQATSTEPEVELGTCDSCRDSFPVTSLAVCECPHKYCSNCIISLFQASMADDTLFPPRCCRQELAVDPDFLPPRLVGQFRAKRLEFDCKDKTYCHESTCSKWVPPLFIKGDVAICVKCSRRTCTRCKGPTHDKECPLDTESQEVLRLAAENGWQRCYSCGRLVELHTGCNHMTCPCRAEFCYVCGLRWKTCQCPQFDEHRLLDQANDRVNRNARAGQVNAGNRDAAVQRARQDILRNHDCQHETWEFRRDDPMRCERCRELMDVFIMECERCAFRACRRCTRHRL